MSQTREAVGEVADEFINGDDPDGNQAEKLAQNELFGVTAHCYSALKTQQKYGDFTDESEANVEQSIDQLRETLQQRANEVLDQ